METHLGFWRFLAISLVIALAVIILVILGQFAVITWIGAVCLVLGVIIAIFGFIMALPPGGIDSTDDDVCFGVLLIVAGVVIFLIGLGLTGVATAHGIDSPLKLLIETIFAIR